MKRILVIGLIFMSSVAQAQTRVEVPMSKVSHKLYVEVSPLTVKLSRAGYDRDIVKILIPQLAEITLLNHRNEGESAPCLATWTRSSADDIHQGLSQIHTLDIQIELKKILVRDTTANSCKVSLQEDITTVIRGELFNHRRTHELPDRSVDDCQ